MGANDSCMPQTDFYKTLPKINLIICNIYIVIIIIIIIIIIVILCFPHEPFELNLYCLLSVSTWIVVSALLMW